MPLTTRCSRAQACGSAGHRQVEATSMENATACVLDGTNKIFWLAQEDNWRPKREQKGLQAESRHVIAIRGRSWSNFRMACNLSSLFDMKQ
jgi:hypothetical protein